MNYWILKSEPVKYPWDKLVKDGITFWDGVRNYQARNNLREMQIDDICLFYHSNEGKEIVGVAKVVKTSYQDPTTEDPNWLVVDISPVFKLKKAVSLQTIKSHPELANIGLIKQQRLSVIKIDISDYNTIINLSNE